MIRAIFEAIAFIALVSVALLSITAIGDFAGVSQ